MGDNNATPTTGAQQRPRHGSVYSDDTEAWVNDTQFPPAPAPVDPFTGPYPSAAPLTGPADTSGAHAAQAPIPPLRPSAAQGAAAVAPTSQHAAAAQGTPRGILKAQAHPRQPPRSDLASAGSRSTGTMTSHGGDDDPTPADDWGPIVDLVVCWHTPPQTRSDGWDVEQGTAPTDHPAAVVAEDPLGQTQHSLSPSEGGVPLSPSAISPNAFSSTFGRDVFTSDGRPPDTYAASKHPGAPSAVDRAVGWVQAEVEREDTQPPLASSSWFPCLPSIQGLLPAPAVQRQASVSSADSAPGAGDGSFLQVLERLEALQLETRESFRRMQDEEGWWQEVDKATKGCWTKFTDMINGWLQMEHIHQDDKTILRNVFIQHLQKNEFKFHTKHDAKNEKTYLFISMPAEIMKDQAEGSKVHMPLKEEIWQIEADKVLPAVYMMIRSGAGKKGGKSKTGMLPVATCSTLNSFPLKGALTAKDAVDGVAGTHGQLIFCKIKDGKDFSSFDALYESQAHSPSPADKPKVIILMNIYESFEWALRDLDVNDSVRQGWARWQHGKCNCEAGHTSAHPEGGKGVTHPFEVLQLVYDKLRRTEDLRFEVTSIIFGTTDEKHLPRASLLWCRKERQIPATVVSTAAFTKLIDLIDQVRENEPGGVVSLSASVGWKHRRVGRMHSIWKYFAKWYLQSKLGQDMLEMVDIDERLRTDKMIMLNEAHADEDIMEVDYVAAAFNKKERNHYVGFKDEMSSKDDDRAFWSSRRQLLCMEYMEDINLAACSDGDTKRLIDAIVTECHSTSLGIMGGPKKVDEMSETTEVKETTPAAAAGQRGEARAKTRRSASAKGRKSRAAAGPRKSVLQMRESIAAQASTKDNFLGVTSERKAFDFDKLEGSEEKNHTASSQGTDVVNLKFLLDHKVFDDWLVPHDADPLFDVKEHAESAPSSLPPDLYVPAGTGTIGGACCGGTSRAGKSTRQVAPADDGTSARSATRPRREHSMKAQADRGDDSAPEVRPVVCPLGSRGWMYDAWVPTDAAPLNQIRKYYGEQIALYVCWTETLHTTLIWPAGLGLFTFIYGIWNLGSHERDFNATQTVTAFNYGLDKVFNNHCTVVFTFVLCGWCTYYFEKWKRIQVTKAVEWDVTNVEEDEPNRPNFRGKIRPNIVTREPESYITLILKLYYLAKSYTLTLVCLSLLCISIASVITFRVVLLTTANAVGSESATDSVLPAILSTIVTLVFGFAYKKLAIVFTDLENHRTQTLYNDNLVVKLFLFQFVNTFSPLFYLAYFRRGTGDGLVLFGDEDLRDNCPEGVSCMGTLTIQVASNLVIAPLTRLATYLLLPLAKSNSVLAKIIDPEPPKTWFGKQFQMAGNEIGYDYTTYDYLDHIMTYAMVTMFAAAFPLAPLVVWVLMFFNVRQMASMLKLNRRPVARRVEDIGYWQSILAAINIIAVLNNAFLLAFTTSFGAELDEQLGAGARVWFIIFFEHAAFGLKYAIDMVIDDIPDSTLSKKKAVALLQNRHKPEGATALYRAGSARSRPGTARSRRATVGNEILESLTPSGQRTTHRRRHGNDEFASLDADLSDGAHLATSSLA